ncbi:rot1 [Fusarium sp. NRRL 52700]|nr:rot1 [Fusarium sp. NRRL 52700]
MHMSQVISIACLLPLTAATIVATITSDWKYDFEDDGENEDPMSVKDLACWNEDEANMINYMGWEYVKDIPLTIAGYEGVNGPHSPLCYTCWILEYQGRRQAMLVLDFALSGFATDSETFGSLADGQAWMTGKTNVTAFHSSDLRDCGIGSEPAEQDRKNIFGDYEPFEESSSKGNLGLVGMKAQ